MSPFYDTVELTDYIRKIVFYHQREEFLLKIWKGCVMFEKNCEFDSCGRNYYHVGFILGDECSCQ